MSEKVQNWFSATELSMLGKLNVAKLPTSAVGSTGRAQRDAWISREVPCMGGKKGIRTEYQPPTDVLALINAFLADNPGFFFKMKTSKAERLRKAERLQSEQEERIRHSLHAFQKYDNRESNLPEITLPLYPEIAEKIGVALAQTYGLGYNSLNTSIRTDLFSALYSALCLLGASQEATPSDEEVKAMLAMAIRFGKAPAPANTDS